MGLDILIDKLTPCLIEIKTGEVKNTVFMLANEIELRNLPQKGWLFDWEQLESGNINIYKLLVEDSDVIQGLVALEVMRGTVYVVLAESAPHNQPQSKTYEGVGGHLFAIAIKLSIRNGFGGHIHFDAKNLKLVQHYKDAIFATHIGGFHEYRMDVDEDAALKVIEKYTLEGEFGT
ncbi:MAG: hypothetical protein FWC16_09550 [Defluviitaleaceae bacterium]|nr:hypothetical protein [Defluviitaleaceae bacterium]MCL2275157.1 hypothetical protein [Defluviitaleaceae bacterium]